MTMISFTKEDLQEILSWGESYWLNVLTINAEKIETKCTPLIKKIQSMIDDYCDHEMGYDAGEHSSCRKCGHRE